MKSAKDIAPMTTKGRAYPTRVACTFQGKDGQIVLDQIRTIDKTRLVRKLGQLDKETSLDAGHFASSGRYDYLKDIAFEYAFILNILE